MTTAARYGAVLNEGACPVCGSADPLGLGACAPCAGREPESLRFFARSRRRADRRAIEAWLIEALGGVIDREAARDVAEGARPIVGLPAGLAGRVAG